MSDWINITIDGQVIKAIKGELLTDAAARAGIEIPVFCSHPKLDPLGACRMCMVESENPRGKALITACTTPVNEGAIFHYMSDKAVDARQGTLEFMLINHPLDCPICDKGGECPLQNQTMEYGPGKSHFWEEKTHNAKNYPLSDLILLDQERCIVCWRCIRYLQEWEDKPQLGLFHRGGETVIEKFPGTVLDAHTSGSIIDLCPVGALTNRVSRFGYRPWELERTPSICTHCGQGCNLFIDSRTHEVRRNVAREHAAVNDEWICDKGRFGIGFSKHPERLTEPLARIDGTLQPVSWQEAIQRVVDGIKNTVQLQGPEAVGALGSAKICNEANYLLGKFMRGLVGSNNVDFREGSSLLADPHGLPSLSDAQDPDVIVLMGCDPVEEMPVLATFLKRAAIRQDARFIIIHARRTELCKYPGIFLNPYPGTEVTLFDALTRAALKLEQEDDSEPLPFWLQAETSSQDISEQSIAEAARLLAGAERPFIAYGTDYAWGQGAKDIVIALTNWIVSSGHGDRLGFLHAQANTQGAGDVGLLPDQLPGRRPLNANAARARIESLWQTKISVKPGLSYGSMIASARGSIRAMYVMGADPVGEKPADRAALQALDFLVVQDLFLTETASLADVVLPAASYVESSGSFTNTERRVQRAPQAVRPLGKSVADWAILMHVARHYAAGASAAWETFSVEAIFAEIAQAVQYYDAFSWESLGESGQQWPRDALPVVREFEVHKGGAFDNTSAQYPYRLVTGAMLWDSGAMIASTTGMESLGIQAAQLNPNDAAELKLEQEDEIEILSTAGSIITRLHIDSAIKPGSVFVPYSLNNAPVGVLFDSNVPRTCVTIRKAS